MNDIDPKGLTIIISHDCVVLGGVPLYHSPRLAELQNLLPQSSTREHRKGTAYLPTLILDDLGLVLRYRENSKSVALVDIYFAVARKPDEPLNPFPGTVILNEQLLKRPFPLSSLKPGPVFRFDNKPVPAAGSSRIGVSIVPKFEYIGTINFGWKEE
jgi:hypothetical protein